MTIAPYTSDKSAIRACFKGLRNLKEKLNNLLGEETLKELYNDGVEQIADKAKNYIKYHASQYVTETKDLFVKEGFESSLNKFISFLTKSIVKFIL